MTHNNKFKMKMVVSKMVAMRMMAMLMMAALMMTALMMTVACTNPQTKSPTDGQEERYGAPETGGGNFTDFKVPVATGYEWEISQSWGEHCSLCEERYPDWNYCSESHTGSCCEHSLDFNLPGYADAGKPVLASGEGELKEAGSDNGWGNYVVVDHGGNVCSRYAHMEDGSTEHLNAGAPVCQGLKLGTIGETGNADGPHLHFQFENCESGETLAMGFSDGNGVPICTSGEDIYDERGRYFLRLTNQLRESCSNYDNDAPFGGGNLPHGGWTSAQCGSLPGCPLIPNCGRGAGHQFSDYYYMTERTIEAAAYLWSECALDGYGDGTFRPTEKITRAQALKIPMFLYGLMGDCGATEPFADVDQEDWYFPVVACAVRHGIIATISDYFLPEQEVTLGEAAKFVVETARRAGVIEMVEPRAEHFRQIGSGHWAFPYVETLYSYGGAVSDLLYRSAASEVDRREYVIMVASMSPCFCQNVSCLGGCICDQATFACIDPDGQSVDSGGGAGSSGGSGDEEDEDRDRDDRDEDEGGDDESGDEEVNDSSGRLDELDLDIECEIDQDDTECEGDNIILSIDCALTNNGDDIVRVNDLVLHLEDDDVCEVTDDDLRDGLSTQHVDPDESRHLNGHFEVTCSEEVADEELTLLIDLVERIRGVVTTYEELLTTELFVDESELDTCGAGSGTGGAGSGSGSSGSSESGSSGGSSGGSGSGSGSGSSGSSESGSSGSSGAPFSWCDPDEGYTLAVESPGGRFTLARTGTDDSSGASLPPGGRASLHVECSGLPAAVLVEAGSYGVTVWTEDAADGGSVPTAGSEFPDFAVWDDYSGTVTINPSSDPDTTASFFASAEGGLRILVRIPAE